MIARLRSRSDRWLRGTVAAGLLGTTTLVAAGCASISPQQERQLGADYAAQVDQELPLVDDSRLESYINELGNRIARGGDRRFDYRFRIVNAEPVNAFAIPGGYIYVNRGLIQEADNMMELAGVLAHEIGHVEERHSVEQIERAQSANLGVNLAYILMGRNPGQAEQAAIGVGGGLVLSKYSREAEDEADAQAIPLLMRAGIHPAGLLTFFRDLLARQERAPSSLEAWFSTHPTTRERIESTEQRLARIPDAQLRNLERDQSAFRAFQDRMARYPAPPPEYRTGS